MTAPIDYLPVAVRGFMAPSTPPTGQRGEPSHTAAPLDGPVLVFDTETTTDLTQALQFGVYRYCRQNPDGTLRTVQEGLFYAEELPDRDPEGFQLLREYARTAVPTVDRSYHDAARELPLLSRREFLDQVLWPAIARARGTLVGFNLPFDLSRLAVHASAGRGSNNGGMSLRLWDHQGNDHPYRPRVAIRSFDARRASIRFTSVKASEDNPLVNPDGTQHRGNFLDLRTLAFALTNENHSLATACAALNTTERKAPAGQHGTITPEYLGYARQDVAATAALYEAAIVQLRQHPIDLPATKAFSPASIAKGYLRAMNVTPPLAKHPHLDRDLLGYAASAFYGGRAECRIRRAHVPVTVVDFTAMYPTVNALLGTWGLLTAESISADDVTAEFRTLLAGLTLDQVLQPALWAQLVGIAEVVPDGDVLPVRARYGANDEWVIAVNPIHTGPLGHTLWYSLPDLVASTLLTGKPPTILRAVRFTPHGRDPLLHTTHLLGEVEVDPARHDFFTRTIEQRQAARASSAPEAAQVAGFLKVLANSGAYGIFAQVNRTDVPAKQRTRRTIHGTSGTFDVRSDSVEEPGDYYFPPIATAITGAARLMLAVLERLVTDAGGAWAFADTDAMAIVTTPTGGLVPCPGGSEQLPDGTPAIRVLSDEQVQAIRERFAPLSPYGADALPGNQLLKMEHTATCFAVSAKRYALYHPHPDGSVADMVKVSEHGLGHLLPPADSDGDDTDWITQAWTWTIHTHLGLPAVEPDWFDRPAVGRTTLSSPTSLRALTGHISAPCYAGQIKPHNFLLVAHPHPLRLPAGQDPRRFRLIAPYTTDPSQWAATDWTNPYNPGCAWKLHTGPDDGSVSPTGTIAVKTYRDVITRHATHPEPKALDATGKPCQRASTGLLTRRPTGTATVTHIGKEAHRLDDAQAGLIADAEEVTASYGAPGDQLLDLALAVLADQSTSHLAAQVGMSAKRLGDVRNRKAEPRAKVRQGLIHAAVATAACGPRRRSLLLTADSDAQAAFLANALAGTTPTD